MITEKLLKKIGCCENGIRKFRNTKILHNVELPIDSIITDNEQLYNDIYYIIDKLDIPVVRLLRYKDEFMEFDDRGNKIKYQKDGCLQQWEYDSDDVITKHTFGDFITTTEYNENGLISKEVTVRDGIHEREMTWCYDCNGNIIKHRDSAGLSYNNYYENKLLVKEEFIYPDNPDEIRDIVKYKYDENNNRISKTWNCGKKDEYRYEDNELIESLSYDRKGNVIASEKHYYDTSNTIIVTNVQK
tara:strand:+ start:2751 stop:3482 length:732 start_codon:yes stop_codon:yes gene_type:complete